MKLVDPYSDESSHASVAPPSPRRGGAVPFSPPPVEAESLGGLIEVHRPFRSGRAAGGLTTASPAGTAGGQRVTADPPRDGEALARQAAMILSAMDAGGPGAARPFHPHYDRRRPEQMRFTWRKRGMLRLFADGPDAEPWVLFSRDANPRALGFITPDRLPLGYGGILSIEDPTSASLQSEVTLIRCRECVGGWYEGALYFNRTQPQFGAGLDAWA